MFTGIVEELGRVRSRAGHRLIFSASTVLDGLRTGDSISHNGCCLTVVEIGTDVSVTDGEQGTVTGWYAVDVVEETLARTDLGSLAEGDPVNLERALRVNDRLGGHIVQGHVDAVGHIVSAAPELEVRIPRDLTRYVVEKGSIAVDGVSLTVTKALPESFTAAVVPHTADVTTLGRKGPGHTVNIEVDLLAKYVERLLVGATAP